MLDAAVERLKKFATSSRDDEIELANFNSVERQQLHNKCDSLNLHHRSLGPEGDRRLVVSRWKALSIVTAAMGAEVVGSLVAREVEPRIYVLGRERRISQPDDSFYNNAIYQAQRRGEDAPYRRGVEARGEARWVPTSAAAAAAAPSTKTIQIGRVVESGVCAIMQIG